MTQRLATPVKAFGIFPRYAPYGRIAGGPRDLLLPVSRAQFIRAGVGAKYTVIATSDPATPYILRSKLDSIGPFARVGQYGVNLLALLPVVLWIQLVARPWLCSGAKTHDGVRERTTASLLMLIKIALLIAVIVFIRILF